MLFCRGKGLKQCTLNPQIGGGGANGVISTAKQQVGHGRVVAPKDKEAVGTAGTASSNKQKKARWRAVVDKKSGRT